MSISEDIKALEEALASGPNLSAREWFEKHVHLNERIEGYPEYPELLLAKNSSGGYSTVRIDCAWVYWQAAWDQAMNHLAYANPDRIKRLLDALDEEVTRANLAFSAEEQAEARLSKAIELLKEADGRSVDPFLDERIAAFLKEVSE